MLKRIVLIWITANFLIAASAAVLTGGWYLRLPLLPGMGAELGLIILPNFILPLLLLRYAWPAPIASIRQALGWQWGGWRPVLVGIVAVAADWALATPIAMALGPGIPYSPPGFTPITGLAGLLFLPVYAAFAVITVAGEETMFRGLIQTQVGARYGTLLGIGLTVLLFGLRHLPADIFYAHLWNATPRMWLAREVDLYLVAILLSLARHFGRSTFASATMHILIFVMMVVQA
jgi:membrane protease YdiL (CAAX protease family)